MGMGMALGMENWLALGMEMANPPKTITTSCHRDSPINPVHSIFSDYIYIDLIIMISTWAIWLFIFIAVVIGQQLQERDPMTGRLKKVVSVSDEVGKRVIEDRIFRLIGEGIIAAVELFPNNHKIEHFESNAPVPSKKCNMTPTQQKNYIKHLPKGAGNYPPNPDFSNPSPPLSAWKSILPYYYYDPWYMYSSPYNRLCDAYGRRNCGGSWYPRTCYREQYDKCIAESIY
jgi:hypothetical protein